MEFDKSKILTCVTAFQATVGMSGWFSDNLMDLEEQIKSNSPKGVISEIYTMRAPDRFVDEDTTAWNLFYPAPEPTYEERQAEWVKQNNVKVGTKFRFTKGFEDGADGSGCCEHRDAKGMEGYIDTIEKTWLFVNVFGGSIWLVPFTALEIIKEPTYRPFKNAEEFKPYRDEWFGVKVGGGFERITFYNDYGVKGSVGNFITYQKLFEAGERENGEPCGIKEEV